MEYIILNGKSDNLEASPNYSFDPSCPPKLNVCPGWCPLGGGGGGGGGGCGIVSIHGDTGFEQLPSTQT